MNRVTLTDDLSLSRLVYGMWRIGDDTDTSPAHVQAKIEACLEITGMLSHFEGRIVSAYEVGAWKPDPGLFLHAAKALGAECCQHVQQRPAC